MTFDELIEHSKNYIPTVREVVASRKRFSDLVKEQNEEARRQRIAVNSPEFLNRTYTI